MINRVRPADFLEKLRTRRSEEDLTLTETVRTVIEAVRQDGDRALCDFTSRFDRWNPSVGGFEVTEAEWDEACATADPAWRAILEEAAQRIRSFHEIQLRRDLVYAERPGVLLMQRVSPLDRVGLYAPGGTASYPSSVLMNAIPAKLAGVPELILTTPAMDGKLNPDLLLAARIAGVNRVFKLGGAQAVAALCFGTESVPSVAKIVGPGNRYVAEAKRQVFGRVGIDMVAGPSEILIIADDSANPRHLALDLLSQAEHDTEAAAVLLTDSAKIASDVEQALQIELAKLPREGIAALSLKRWGMIVLCADLSEAAVLANAYAPEHLELAVANPFDLLPAIRHAGSIFLGLHCPEAVGDYFAGCNHTLPTSGTARFSSALSVDDFVKKTQICSYTAAALAQDAAKIAFFAEREGLSAHARSALCRLEENQEVQS